MKPCNCRHAGVRFVLVAQTVGEDKQLPHVVGQDGTDDVHALQKLHSLGQGTEGLADEKLPARALSDAGTAGILLSD